MLWQTASQVVKSTETVIILGKVFSFFLFVRLVNHHINDPLYADGHGPHKSVSMFTGTLRKSNYRISPTKTRLLTYMYTC